MYQFKLVNDIEEYINDEVEDSIYYCELSKIAPTNLSKDLLLEFSNDEKSHAENFKQAYYYMTGRMFVTKLIEPPKISEYKEALKIRMLAETKDYKKYGEQYLLAPNKYLKDLFFMTRTVEAQHAMRIPILFEEK